MEPLPDELAAAHRAQLVSDLAKVQEILAHHGAWGWQQDNLLGYGERRIKDSTVIGWGVEFDNKIRKLTKKYLIKLMQREDELSPHGSRDPSRVLTAFRRTRHEDKCPSCGTHLRLAGTLPQVMDRQ